MHRWFSGLTVLAVLILGPVCSATAQQSVFNPSQPIQAPYMRPALSPYLNLLRGGDPAANYYLGVLPEVDRRYQQARVSAALVDLSTRINLVDRALEERGELGYSIEVLPPSGHSAGFLIYNAYYTMPGARGYIPYNPASSRQTQQQPQR